MFAEVGKMTRYEFLKNQKSYCLLMARAHADDPKLAKFYNNAAEGYQIKINKLTVQEAAR